MPRHKILAQRHTRLIDRIADLRARVSKARDDIKLILVEMPITESERIQKINDILNDLRLSPVNPKH